MFSCLNTQSRIPAKLISLRDHTLAGRIEEYIRVNGYERPELLNSQALSRQFCVCAKKLYTLFMAKHNSSVHAFVMQVRHKEFCERLQQGIPIKRIAIEAGYRDLSNFSRDFKRIAALSPQAFLLKQRELNRPPFHSHAEMQCL